MMGNRGSLEGRHGHLRAPDVSQDEPKVQDGTPLVSVVIPCYNQAHFLGEAIASVISQSNRHCGLIVADDGSTGERWAVASRYEGVRLISEENQDLFGAR